MTIGHYPDTEIAAACLTIVLVAAGVTGFITALHIHTHRPNTDEHRARAIAAATAGGLALIFGSGPEMFINGAVTAILAPLGLALVGYAFWLEHQPTDPDRGETNIPAGTGRDLTRDAAELGTTAAGLRNRNFTWTAPRSPRPGRHEDGDA